MHSYADTHTPPPPSPLFLNVFILIYFSRPICLSLSFYLCLCLCLCLSHTQTHTYTHTTPSHVRTSGSFISLSHSLSFSLVLSHSLSFSLILSHSLSSLSPAHTHHTIARAHLRIIDHIQPKHCQKRVGWHVQHGSWQTILKSQLPAQLTM